ncbi:MAG TPA: MBL fold metallo-hydrolase [Gemmatimonadaceae bacterium]|nr:MBL fold metallo-hydrolase [Gemmatimonadaceae bacterium]
MLLKRFYDTKLAQASYLIGCQKTGEAIVIDANRDVAQYVAAAAEEGVRVTHVTETHIHADFVSGSRELAQRTGARLLLSDEGGADWKYEFAASANATLLHDHDTFMIGNLRFEVLHTPGHTPEHIAFLVTDTPASASAPIGVVTGDFLFVGDVGRPDLLEKAAHMAGTMEAGARTLFRSLQNFRQLPDHLQIWPGHGAGSACGKALGAVPTSTLGYEKLVNWGLGIDDEQAFVDAVLDGQPEPPKYFAEMKRINKAGPAILGGFHRPPELSTAELDALLRDRAPVIDTRPADVAAAGMIPGTINIPLGRSFSTWAGWLLPYDRDVFLLVQRDDAENAVDAAVRDLAMIGLDRVAGWCSAQALDAWAYEGRELVTIARRTPTEVSTQLQTGAVTVLDVRGASEFDAGHLPGVRNIPVGYLTSHLGELQRDWPLVVHCQGGARSAIAASLLQAHGFTNVLDMTGGFTAWTAAGLPVVHTDAATAGAQ